MPALLLRTPTRRTTIWLVFASLLIFKAISVVVFADTLNAQGAFDEDDDEYRKYVVLTLAGIFMIAPVLAAIVCLCLRKHNLSVSLFAFNKSNPVLSTIFLLICVYACYTILNDLVKIHWQTWHTVLIDVALIWFFLVLRATVSAPRDQL